MDAVKNTTNDSCFYEKFILFIKDNLSIDNLSLDTDLSVIMKNSLKFVSLMIAIENEFSVEFDVSFYDNIFKGDNFKTVKDFADFIQNMVQ